MGCVIQVKTSDRNTRFKSLKGFKRSRNGHREILSCWHQALRYNANPSDVRGQVQWVQTLCQTVFLIIYADCNVLDIEFTSTWESEMQPLCLVQFIWYDPIETWRMVHFYLELAILRGVLILCFIKLARRHSSWRDVCDNFDKDVKPILNEVSSEEIKITWGGFIFHDWLNQSTPCSSPQNLKSVI